MNKQKGFTLVELMIVVAIVGVLAAVAIPKFAQMRAESYKKKHGVYPQGYDPNKYGKPCCNGPDKKTATLYGADGRVLKRWEGVSWVGHDGANTTFQYNGNTVSVSGNVVVE